MADPAAAIKQVSDELKEKFNESGMSKVEEFTDKMDDLLAKIKEGPGNAMKAAQGKFDEMKAKVESAKDDPSTVAPGGGMAACASWYGNAVVGKLGSLGEEVQGLADSLSKVASEVSGPMEELGGKLEKAIADLEGSVKSLAKLPKTVADAVAGKDSPDDIAKIDMDPIKNALAGGDVDGPLNVIMGMKEVLDKAVSAISGSLDGMQGFIEGAPDKVRSAFDVPMPLCFMTSSVQSQAPQAMQDLLKLCKALEGVSLQPLIDSLKGSSEVVGGIDVDTIKTPVNKFMESAKESVDKMDKAVAGAKLMSNPAGAVGDLAKGLPGW